MMGYGQGYGYGGYGNMMGGWGGWLFLLFGLIALAGIVLLVMWAVRSMSGSGQHPQTPPRVDDACAIARARFAKGEITREQYEEICKVLGV
jgi:putative membrane protein